MASRPRAAVETRAGFDCFPLTSMQAEGDVARSVRSLWAQLLFVLLIAGSIASLATRRELWPFSPYPMYAWVEREERLARYDLVGLTRDRGEIRIRATEHLWPLDDARFIEAIVRIHAERGRASALEALAYVGWHYERRRRAGEHGGPPLSHLQLHLSQWPRLDPKARDVDTPASRRLILEVAVPGGSTPR